MHTLQPGDTTNACWMRKMAQIVVVDPTCGERCGEQAAEQ